MEFFYRDGKPKIQAPILSWSDSRIVCIVPVGEVSDYDASAGSGPVTVSGNGQTSNEFPFKVTFGNGQLRWPSGQNQIPYYLNDNARNGADGGLAVQAAANTWNQTGASIRFTQAGSHHNRGATWDHQNEVAWGRTSTHLALAETYYWAGADGELQECDIVFNDPDYTWSTGDTLHAREVDVQSVALHELGHWLSLRDIYGDVGDREYDSAKVMYGIGSLGQLKRDLHPDDVAGIQHIYAPGAPPSVPASIDYPKTQEDGHYGVTWAHCPEASSYQLERSTDGGLNWTQVYGGPHTSFVEGLGSGTYRYRARATNVAGPSEWQTGTWDCVVLIPPER